MQILKENFFECIVVGGGTCGLAAAARLCENYPGAIYTEEEHQRFHWLKQRGKKVRLVTQKNQYQQKKFDPSEILVLDGTSDKFMGQWDNQFASCQIPHLRSPMFFHPDPVNIDAMVTYAHLNRRELELMEITNVVGREYSKHQLKKLTNKNSKKMPFPGSNTQDKPGIIDINMRDWRDYYRPGTKFFHDFCRDIVERYNLQNSIRKDEVVSIEYTDIDVVGSDEVGRGFIIKTQLGRVYGSKVCICAIGHRGNINFPLPQMAAHATNLAANCHTTHIFKREVAFPPSVGEKLVVIVGGGLTSAQLAHVLVGRGTKVHLLLRGPLKVKHFDFHLDWVTKYRNVKKSAFYIRDLDEERWQMIQDAREGGSVNPEYHRKLMKHVKSGMLALHRFTEIQNAEYDGTWKLELQTFKNDKNTVMEPKEAFSTQLHDVGYVICATGISPDINGLPFLQQIVKQFPIPTVRGLPCLTDDLQWNSEVPLFMVGKNASLRTGPLSANLDGARLGAERIGWFIQDRRAQGEYDWSFETSSDESLDTKLDNDEVYNTRLRLASGQMNWYEILGEA